MIVVTGGAGFIGSAIIWELNRRGINNILVVDRLGTGKKWLNLRNLKFIDYMDKSAFLEELTARTLPAEPEAILHLGACSSTIEDDADYLMENNFRYTKQLAEFSLKTGCRFIYASSAATYGSGELGCSDSQKDLQSFQPLNKYAFSKYLFDVFAQNKGWLKEMAGLKYFNVYGPNEYHKGEMRSVIHKSFEQIKQNGTIKLFKSHRPDYEDGEQKRDFLYVKDAVKMTLFFLDNPRLNGLFNIGAGTARTFNELALTIFSTLQRNPKIDYFPMPEKLRSRYQYFTEANLDKLRAAGFEQPISSLEEGIKDYLTNYLLTDDPYLG